jgi:hypothetical protein
VERRGKNVNFGSGMFCVDVRSKFGMLLPPHFLRCLNYLKCWLAVPDKASWWKIDLDIPFDAGKLLSASAVVETSSIILFFSMPIVGEVSTE